jgi:hypothetical protein
MNGRGHQQVSTPGASHNAKGSDATVEGIDTRITVNQGRVVKTTVKGGVARKIEDGIVKKIDRAKSSNNTRESYKAFGPSAKGDVARNAVGAVLVDHSGAAKGPNVGRQGSGPPSADGTAKNDAATNPVGGTAKGYASVIRANIGQRGGGPRTPAGATTAHAATINGTGMTRLHSGTGAVGGPAKTVAGIINGSEVKPKHP